MKTTIITFKTDPQTKDDAQKIAEELGLNLSVVLNALLKDFVRDRSLSIQLDGDSVEESHKKNFPQIKSVSKSAQEKNAPEFVAPIWHTTTVIHGDKTGRTIGFPTANLDMRLMDPTTKHGVWATEIKIGTKLFMGALYYGPRLVKGEHHTVLEIYILDFNQRIYDEQIWFRLEKYIRGVQDFSSLDALKDQLQTDVYHVRQAFEE